MKKPNQSLSLVLCALIPFLAVRIIAAEDIFPLKDLGPTVDELLKSSKSDTSELAYVSARGSALLLAISKYLDENPGRDADAKLSKDMMLNAHRYAIFSVWFGLKAGKSVKNSEAQIKMLLDIYETEMIRSKQLNNKILSPAISRDLENIERIAPLVNRLAEILDKQSYNPPVDNKSKP